MNTERSPIFIDEELEETCEMEELIVEEPKHEANWKEWEYSEWERITNAHADSAPESPTERSYTQFDMNRIYKKARNSRRERTGIRAARYAMVAVCLAALAYFTREISWLAVVLSGVSVYTGLIAAYGIGRYHEM